MKMTKRSIAVLVLFILAAIYFSFLFAYNDKPLKKMNFLVVVLFCNLAVLMMFWIIIQLIARKTLNRGMQDFLIGDNQGYSLSRLQAVLWAITIMGSQFSIMCSIWLGHGFNYLHLYQPVFSDSALWLLGLSLTSCIAVKGITVERIRSGQDLVIKAKPRLSDIVMGANGLDFSKCQMLIWTMVGIFSFDFNTYNFIYAVAECSDVSIPVLLDHQYSETLLKDLGECNPFVPYLAWSFVVLMGISQGAYVGKKLIPAGLTPESIPPGNDTGTGNDREVPEAVIQQAILDNRNKWLKDFDVKAISVGWKRLSNDKEVNCIVFQPVSKISPETLPNTQYIPPVIVYFWGPETERKEYHIPTDVQPIGSDIKSSAEHNRTCHGNWPKRPGCSVSRIHAGDSGTIGMKVFRGKDPFFVSCYHVLCGPELNAEKYFLRNHSPDPARSVISPSGQDSGLPEDKIGEVVEGYIDEFTDCALARLSDSFLLADKPWSHLTAPMETRDLSSDDVKKQLQLSIYGRSSGYRTGNLKFLHTDCDVEYTIRNRAQYLKLSGLIQTSRLSEGGDSGAPVCDPDGFIVGMIVATSSADSFIIPINRVLSYLNVTIKPKT
ncbi:hypothetical protein V9K67_20625 [Paraflavisolibacter sp. H34]|uniref:hypothetical protein n=1 Tax=Huijunlia imazamoxiresistens TaxID=3127457 RepID=UPI0030180C96